MADINTKGTASGACTDTCGCPSPCPGGQSCRCTTSGGEEMVHMKCSCGDHCGCNPCTCSKIETQGRGKEFCKCGAACSCATCAS